MFMTNYLIVKLSLTLVEELLFIANDGSNSYTDFLVFSQHKVQATL